MVRRSMIFIIVLAASGASLISSPASAVAVVTANGLRVNIGSDRNDGTMSRSMADASLRGGATARGRHTLRARRHLYGTGEYD